MILGSRKIGSAPLSSTLASAYNDFLYAPVGEDKNGAYLTVLSVFARRNVDPWEEAADLSRLPRDSAMQKLISMIKASSGLPSTTAELTAIADRVIALLPGRAAPAGRTHDASPGAPPLGQAPAGVRLTLFAIYMALMILSQWMAASAFEKAREDGASTASVPSKLGESLPSTRAGNRQGKSPQ